MSYNDFFRGFLFYASQCIYIIYIYSVKHIHSFIHSGHFYSAPSSPLTTQRCSRPQNGYCIGISRQSAQATAGKGLAQGPYTATRAGVKPTALRLKAIDSTKAPPCPMSPLPF